MTADGELVLLHDPLLDLGTTVSGWAHQRTAAEIRAGWLRHRDGTPSDERPLLLDELLDLAPPTATLQLEVKAHANPALARRTARAVCERLSDHAARERTEIISFWSGACELAAEFGFRSRLVIIADSCVHALAVWGGRVGQVGTASASSISSSLAHWSQTSKLRGSASRPAPSTTPRSSRHFCRLASTRSQATLLTSCARRSATNSRRRRLPSEPHAHAHAQRLVKSAVGKLRERRPRRSRRISRWRGRV